jgi:membrane protease YdiL (CAAX protease family)
MATPAEHAETPDTDRPRGRLRRLAFPLYLASWVAALLATLLALALDAAPFLQGALGALGALSAPLLWRYPKRPERRPPPLHLRLFGPWWATERGRRWALRSLAVFLFLVGALLLLSTLLEVRQGWSR